MSTVVTEGAADRGVARGVLAESREGAIVLAIPSTEYRLLLMIERPPAAQVGQRIAGVIAAQAMRIDAIRSGGAYIEPIAGRPRRVQGRIIAVDPSTHTLTIDAGVPIRVRTDGRQRAAQFERGQMVSLDVEPGASFAMIA